MPRQTRSAHHAALARQLIEQDLRRLPVCPPMMLDYLAGCVSGAARVAAAAGLITDKDADKHCAAAAEHLSWRRSAEAGAIEVPLMVPVRDRLDG